MINENDRNSLIKYRVEQAKDTIELAKFLIDSNRFIVAVNRIYYGLYYSVTALAIKNQFATSKHAQLIGWFNKEYIASEILDKRYGKILRNAYQNRTKGDYDAFVSFDKEEVIEMYNEMIDFIKTIEKLIDN
jgi:uncharacterized protein (UPF0332 family)